MCPDDYQIASFIDGLLAESEKTKIENHLNHCLSCMEKVFFLKKALFKEDFFSKETSIIEKLVLKIKDSFLEIKEKTGSFICLPLETAYRNGVQTEKSIQLQIHQSVFKLSFRQGSLIISSEKPEKITVASINGRLLFSGELLPEQPFTLPFSESLEIETGGKKIKLDFEK
ncbi:MAG TPA: hypothetical protein DHW82_01725 [Spirochaetia bacterium]|nr:MAG: hypothetical protein A2Y41_13770 [Spirochaetes bacterium GWB1_36_13]HCL55714.1 hypothetical protein [Spirochaetia bacterium]